MATKDKVVAGLLAALIAEWDSTYPIEEVACDESKVALMIDALKHCGEPPTPEVREFYRKVFLRDVWDKSGNDATSSE